MNAEYIHKKCKYIYTGKWKIYTQENAEDIEMNNTCVKTRKCFNLSKNRYTWKEG